MKRMKKVLLMALCATVAFSFLGCKKEADKTKDIPIIKVTNAEVEFAYKNAARLYIALTYGGLTRDSEDTISFDSEYGIRYMYRVKVGNVNSYKDLEAYLGSFFSTELVKAYMDKMQSNDWTKLVEENGKLYTNQGGEKDANITYIDESYSYTKVNDYKIIMHVEVKTYIDWDASDKIGVVVYDFVYENLDGKKWVFTSFPYSYT